MSVTLTKHTATCRPVAEDDIKPCVRGLQMHATSSPGLVELIQAHARLDLFASAVIVVAAARVLFERGTLDWDDFSMPELLMIGLDPDERMQRAVQTQLADRDLE